MLIKEMIEIVEQSIINANNNITKLNNKAFFIEGMSGRKNRIFLNSLLNVEGAKYFEVGVWKGSTMYSALYNNNIDYVVGVDNWSEFGGPKDEFLNNMEDLATKFDFYDLDCFSIDKKEFKDKFNIYFYDGNHDEINQEKALTHFYDCLEDNFIYICDDWDFHHVRTGTKSGLDKTRVKIEREWVLGNPNVRADGNGWWNGIYVACCSKQ